ncbi:MAG: type IIL restriction-modification enzyme MmeI [Methylococcales bacterium]
MKNNERIKTKYIYTNITKRLAKNINPYLIDANTVFIKPRSKPISNINKMSIGNVPLDGNSFILNLDEKKLFIEAYPEAKKFIKKYIGASDFMKSSPRYCIWVTDENKDEAFKIAFIAERIERCKNFRLNGGVVARQYVHVAYRFRTQPHQETQSIIYPKTTSSRRDYIPVGFLDEGTIISEKALASYGPKPYLFGILSSKMHILWLSITSSRMRNDYQYSVQLTYNTFPFPDINDEQKRQLEQHVFNVLDEREQHSEKTMAQLYDPDKMPAGLRKAHHEMDLAVEQCYRPQPFKSDEERLEYLFKLYEKMIAAEVH